MNRFVVIDLEATCWEKGAQNGRVNETIEIGAVMVDLDTHRLVDRFDTFVRPVRNPELSVFCTQLTSITQADVDRAELFPVVFDQFTSWVEAERPFVLASWGNYDRQQLLADCQYHGVEYPFGDNHLNLKQLFAETQNGRKYGMKRALRILGLQLEGTHHRAIDDAWNAWRVYRQLILN